MQSFPNCSSSAKGSSFCCGHSLTKGMWALLWGGNEEPAQPRCQLSAGGRKRDTVPAQSSSSGASTAATVKLCRDQTQFGLLGWYLLFFKSPPELCLGRKVPVALQSWQSLWQSLWQCPQGWWCQASRMSPAGAVLPSELPLEQSSWCLGDLSKCSICSWRWGKRNP